tara:strand:+ start:21556 stop:21762 length:207 start_codon:yes stop_codon:yes gene_type:complete
MNKHLRIVRPEGLRGTSTLYIKVLSDLARDQTRLHAAGVKSALPHFIAIVKELERVLAFEFKEVDLEE